MIEGLFTIYSGCPFSDVGASGVSSELRRAVWPEGIRLAPSASVTDTIANSNPDAAVPNSPIRPTNTRPLIVAGRRNCVLIGS